MIEGELDETLQRSRDRRRHKSSTSIDNDLVGGAKPKTMVSDNGTELTAPLAPVQVFN
jgi:hypothetical protein